MTLPMPKADTPLPVPPVAPLPATEQESFVINLCSSTTPMALTQPQLAELKSYTFFVSRRLEDGRERFRLHMGYFDSQLQAEDMLPVVRDLYPGAWAGEAPGKRLRAAAAKAKPAAAIAPVVAPVVPVVRVAPVVPVAAAVVPVALAAAPSAAVLANMPTLSAAPELTVVAPALTLELVAELPPPVAAAPPAVPASPPPVVTPAVVVAPVPAPAPAPVMARRPDPPAAAPASPPVKAGNRAGASKRDAGLPFDKRSNVREVLKSLDESVRQPATLPESQVLHLLEEKRGDPLNTCSTPAAFAVQLQWSVQAIDLARVPSLAIFGAYTLYTVEGSREGRRWFGLRLGFFSDANSAKQVAQYVRSEFSSVAVVPVSLKERDGASGATGRAATGAGGGALAPGRPIERLPDQSAEFKLLDDTAETPKLTVPAAAATAARAAGSASAAKPRPAVGRPATGRPGSPGRAPGKTAKSRGNRVHAHEKRGPQTLEETLEILGADQLQMEDATKPLVSDGTVRHLDVKVQKNSPFSRLLDRLAERGR